MATDDWDGDADGSRGDLAGDSSADARRKAGHVGLALILVAIFGGLTNVGVALVANAVQAAGPKPQPPANMPPDMQRQWERGRDSAPGMQLCGAVCVSLIYIPVLLGGLRLQQGEGHGLGTTAAVLALLPCSAAFLVGLPVGIWALAVLGRPDVKEALEPPRPQRQRRRRDDDDRDDRPRRKRRTEDEET